MHSLLCLLLIASTVAVHVIATSTAAPSSALDALAAQAKQLYTDALHSGDKTHAVELYQAAIATFPLATAYNNLGLLLHELGEQAGGSNGRHREQALEVLTQGAQVAQDANDAATYVAIESNIGFILRDKRHKSVSLCLEAITHFDRALAVDPENVHAMYNKASALYGLREFDAAETLNRRVLAREPLHVGANTDLGIILFYSRRDLEAAVRHQDTVITTAESWLVRYGALTNKATFLRGDGKFALALEAYEQAYALRPDDSIALSNVLVGRRPLCVWEGIHELQDTLVALAIRNLAAASDAAPILPFEATLMPLSDAFRKQLAVAESRQAYQAVTLELAPSRFTLAPSAMAHERPATLLRIGYLSYDFRDHPMGQLILGFVEYHDERAVESYCYSYGTNDGSEWRRRAEARCGTFRDLFGLSDVEAAQQIARDHVDVVVDLMGHTTGARCGILALKPSRIVVNYLGYPGTTGASETDFVLLDRFVVPLERAQTSMSEHVVYLPTTYQSNLYESEPQSCLAVDAPDLETVDSNDDALDDDLSAYPCPLATRSAQHLPASAIVFCNFNTINKMEPVAFAVWMRILHQVSGSVLWLLTPSSSHDADATMATLRREAQAHGVHASRIVFATWEARQAHLARLTLADIFLDSFVYNAHSTASDALWANVPLVTLWGDTFPSRVAASLLANALERFPELTPHSLKDYEAVAVRLAQTPALLRRYRHELASHTLSSPLFDTKQTASHLEAAYRAMHDLTQRMSAGKTRFHVLVRPRGMHPSLSREQDARTRSRVQAAVQEGVRRQQLGDLPTAQYFYRLALRTDRTHADALHLLGTAVFASGQARTAQRLLTRVVQDHPDVALYRTNAARVHLSLGERAKAAEEVSVRRHCCVVDTRIRTWFTMYD